MLTLTFLGTSAGIPTKHRNVTALAVSLINPYSKAKNVPWILVDCGEATQHQLLKTPLSMMQLALICITHVHGDHCYGLPGLLASMAMSGRKHPLTLIAPQAIADYLAAVQATTALMISFDINFIAIDDRVQDDSYQPITLDLTDDHQLQVDVIALSHRILSHAFKFTQRLSKKTLLTQKLTELNVVDKRLWGKLKYGIDVNLDDNTLLKSADFVTTTLHKTVLIVAGDNDSPELLDDAIPDTDVLVHEATYTQAIADKRKVAPNYFDPMHSTAKQVAEFAQLSQLKNLILTHFSARFQPFDKPSSKTLNMSDIRAEVATSYQGNFWLAQDFDEFEIENGNVKKRNTQIN